MTVNHSDSHALTTYSEDISTSKSIAFTLDVPLHHPPPLVEIRAQASALACSPKSVLGGRCFLPPWHPEVTPSQWHTGLPQAIRKSLVWQTKYFKCVRAIANHIFNTIFFGDKTMLKVGNRHWYTRIDSKTAAFHSNEKSNQFCSTRPVILS